MRIHYECLPCLVNQAVKVADITNAEERDVLFKKVFAYLATIDFSKTNPEIIGATFRLLKEHTKNDDPYREIRHYYNRLFLGLLDGFANDINRSDNPFEQAVKYAIIGNVIDFSPMQNTSMEHIMKSFSDVDETVLAVNHTAKLMTELINAKRLLYLGDNCGEICLDKLLVQKIKEHNPNIEIFFGVRGAPVINDSIAEDAAYVGIDDYAKVISNGDDSLGTVLSRTSAAFNEIYQTADIIIAKGQANYESLSDENCNRIYFLLMTKCEVIAKAIGVVQRSLICMKGASASGIDQ